MKPKISIGIDFGDGITREYELVDELARKFCEGEAITIETNHPKKEEKFIAKIKNESS